MKKKLPRKYYLIPALYLLLIIGFLNLHLSESGGRYITHTLGAVSIRYRQESGVRKSVSRLTLRIAGMTADLSDGVPVEDAGGRKDIIEIKDVTFKDGILKIILSRGGSIEVASDFSLAGGIHSTAFQNTGEDSGFSLIFRADTESTDDFLPVLSFSFIGNISVHDVLSSLPLVGLQNEEQQFLIAHNYNVSYDNQQMTIKFNRGTSPGFYHEAFTRFLTGEEQNNNGELIPGIVAEQVSTEDELRYWLFGNHKPVSQAELETMVRRISARMYSFWRNGGDAQAGQVLSALNAYSLKELGRTDFSRNTELFESARQAANWNAAPFVGNVVQAEQDYSNEEQGFIRRMENLSVETMYDYLADSVKATDYPSVISRIVFAGDEAQSSDVISDLKGIFENALANRIRNSSAAAGMFETVVTAASLYPEEFGFMDALLEQSYQQIVPFIMRIDSRLVYRAFSGSGAESEGVRAVNPFVQLRVARALRTYAKLRNDRLSGELGNSLLSSALSMMDNKGALPAEIIFSQENIQPTDSVLAPSEIYPFFEENNYYPRVVSLAKELGEDIRLWTSANAVGAVQRPDGFEITLDFVVGETEYIVLRGVEPFSSLEMYGMEWGGDWRFQNYDVGGWFYDRERRVLYMKIRHREKIERIKISIN